jgi:hypothetical protein
MLHPPSSIPGTSLARWLLKLSPRGINIVLQTRTGEFSRDRYCPCNSTRRNGAVQNDSSEVYHEKVPPVYLVSS